MPAGSDLKRAGNRSLPSSVSPVLLLYAAQIGFMKIIPTTQPEVVPATVDVEAEVRLFLE